MHRYILILALTVLAIPQVADQAQAEPGWSPVVIPTGAYREQIKSMPIEQRPYRPFHFYGNTVRRSYYRGTPYTQRSSRQMTIGNVQPVPVFSGPVLMRAPF